MPENCHTPTPWVIHPGMTTVILGGNPKIPIADTNRYLGLAEDEANAAFIVRAVNAHDALVKALERMIPVVSKQLAQYVSSEIIQAEAALKLARGNETPQQMADSVDSEIRRVAKATARAADYTQERTTLIAAIAFAMGHTETPTRVYEKLRDALTSTLGKDPA